MLALTGDRDESAQSPPALAAEPLRA